MYMGYYVITYACMVTIKAASITGKRCLLAMGKSSSTNLILRYLFPYHSQAVLRVELW